MIITISKEELGVVIHSLIEERDRIVRGGGNQYGNMTLEELDDFIVRLQIRRLDGAVI